MAKRKKKAESLTPRQRQSQRIMREKKARKQRQLLVHRAVLIGGATAALLVTGGGIWAWKSGKAAETVQTMSDGVYALSVKAGFAVQDLYLDGRSRTSMEDIEKAMAVSKGDPILRVSLEDMRQRLEKIESVQFATVERELPGSLYVHIVEREPVALWQHDGKLALVDDNGAVMNDLDSTQYKKLPLIVGDDAPAHVAELLGMLSSEPELAKRFTAAIRVGGRRWNVRLSGGTEVKLPEENPQKAWSTLAQLQEKQQLLERNVKVIDLRVEGRLFIKLPPEDMPNKTADAKDT